MSRTNRIIKTRNACLAAVGLAVLVLLASCAPGNVMRASGSIAYRSKTNLIQTSDLIVRVTVKEFLPSRWSNPDFARGDNIRNIIQTDVLMTIEEVYKGAPYDAEVIAVRINKGKVGRDVLYNDGHPDFEQKETVLLFLARDDSDVAQPDENYYVLSGMIQGIFRPGDDASVYGNINRDIVDPESFRDEIKDALDAYDPSVPIPGVAVAGNEPL